MTNGSSWLVALAILGATVAPARAQTAEAETLFREGKKLLKKNKTAEACAKFEASERLEPNTTTELNLGACHAKLGQTATAWVMFVRAAASAKRAGSKEASDEAKKRAAALEKVLIHLTIAVPGDHALDGLVIKRNQTSIDHELWNQEVPVDPDDYTITAEAPDRLGWSVTVAVKTKSKVIEVPELEPDPHAPAHAKPEEPAVAAAPHDQPHPPPPPPPRPLPRRKNASTVVALGAIGVGALALGTGFGLYSSHLASEADATCPAVTCADANAVDQNHSARTYGWVANVSWGIGAVALVGAAAAWWRGKPVATDAVTVVPTGGRDRAGLALEGRF